LNILGNKLLRLHIKWR